MTKGYEFQKGWKSVWKNLKKFKSNLKNELKFKKLNKRAVYWLMRENSNHIST